MQYMHVIIASKFEGLIAENKYYERFMRCG